MKALPKSFAGRCIQRERLCVHSTRASSCAHTTSRMDQVSTDGELYREDALIKHFALHG